MTYQKTIIILFCLSSFLSVSALAQTYYKIDQRTAKKLVAGVGDAVVRIEKREKLKNAFGKNDIFGRKKTTGYITILYAGLEDGKAYFQRDEVDVETGANTMNSTPQLKSNSSTSSYSGKIDGKRYSGTITKIAPMEVILPKKLQSKVTGKRQNYIVFDINQVDKQLYTANYEISILDINSSRVVYSIKELK